MFRELFERLFAPRTSRQRTGRWAESLAADELRRKGLRVESRNFLFAGFGRKGELDLVARNGRQLVFVEVRARQADNRVGGYFSVGARKREALRRAVQSYLRREEARTGDPPAWRFDIVEVSFESRRKYELRHYEGVKL